MPSNNSWGAIQTRFEYNDQFSSLFVLNGDATLYALTNTEVESFIFLYNPDKNIWKTGGDDDPFPRWGVCGVTDGHHLYIIGGTSVVDHTIKGTAKVKRYDPSADSWEEVSDMNERRNDAFGAAMNGKIYVAGGMQEDRESWSVLNTSEVYNPSSNEWHLIPSLNVPRYYASMVCYMGALYVVGGLKDRSKSRELSVEVFDTDTNEWKEKSNIPVKYENGEKVKKTIHFKACSAKIHKDVLQESIQ